MQRRHVRSLIGLIVSLLAIAGFVWWATKQQAPEFPSTTEGIALLVGAIAAYLVATLIRGWRWNALLWDAEIEHRATDAYELVFVGYMGNTVLPARGGEILRVLILGEKTGQSRRKILGTIVAERILDLVALVTLFSLLAWFGISGAVPDNVLAAALAIALVGVAVGVYVYLQLRKRGRFERFAETLRPFARSSKDLVSLRGVALLLVTMCVWAMEGSIFWLIGRSLELSLDFFDGLTLVAMASLAALIPAAPGYAGTYDGAIVIGLKGIGITGSQALTFTLLVRFIFYVPVTVIGLVLLLARFGGLRRLRFMRREGVVNELEEIAAQPER